MSKKYSFKEIEAKWQKKWDKDKTYACSLDSDKDKYYALFEFPYPSGDGLHMGHVRPSTGMDIIARKRRMQGYNVLYPIGWDGFGLPTENFAIKNKISPQEATKQNTENFEKQFRSLGMSFDWDRLVDTTDPNYYKWTQWMFKQFFENDFAYKKAMTINWCPNCKIGLANEEVVNGNCERCGSPVEQKEKEQWMLAITKYADKLLNGLKELDYIQPVVEGQVNWIGKSEGFDIQFAIDGSKEKIRVFTTRPDTIFGATYMVLAPEHELVGKLESSIENVDEVKDYADRAVAKTELERQVEQKDKTGVELKGVKAVNPATGEKIPVWIADYVLGSYGTGAIMAVPAHDERDFEFAKKFELPIVCVVSPWDWETNSHFVYRDNVDQDDQGILKSIHAGEKVYVGNGKLINSEGFDGMNSSEAVPKMGEKYGKAKTQYKLRDWVFSRQRYWGEPIPLVHCEKCGWVAVPDEELPIELPKLDNYEPRDDGESPLASVEEWVNVTCSKCNGPAKRETDTMPNWAGSSWYFLRYMDPKNDEAFASKEALDYFGQVNWYNGGMEHVTLHLLYSRFWNMALHDLGHVPNAEPYKKRTAHGMILAEGGVKMSKSKGNVINPNDLVEKFGADATRLYEMFIGPFDQAVAWDKRGILGPSRFLEKVWRYFQSWHEDYLDDFEQNRVENEKLYSMESWNDNVNSKLHRTIKSVSEDIESMSFNTAISSLMEFVNVVHVESQVERVRSVVATPITIPQWKLFLQLLHPFAPHIASELYEKFEGENIDFETWPEHDESLMVEDTFDLVVQVNGKTRGTVSASVGMSQEEAEKLAKDSPMGEKWLGGEIEKVVFVKDRLINFIV